MYSITCIFYYLNFKAWRKPLLMFWIPLFFDPFIFITYTNLHNLPSNSLLGVQREQKLPFCQAFGVLIFLSFHSFGLFPPMLFVFGEYVSSRCDLYVLCICVSLWFTSIIDLFHHSFSVQCKFLGMLSGDLPFIGEGTEFTKLN